jgi:hypothetical protein
MQPILYFNLWEKMDVHGALTDFSNYFEYAFGRLSNIKKTLILKRISVLRALEDSNL